MRRVNYMAICGVANDIAFYGFWATYATMRDDGNSRAHTLWLIWVAYQHMRYSQSRNKFTM
jgi:hypothetical protein